MVVILAELGLDILADVKKATMNLKALEQELKNLSKDSKYSSKSLSVLGDESKKSSSKMESVKLSTNKASKGLRNLSGDANRTTSEIARLGKTMSGLSLGNLLGVGLASGTFAKVVQSIMDVEETVNLFNISMGMAAEETEAALRKISDAAGLDHTILQQATGNYTLLARSMGVAADNAAILGRSSTRLALDLSSLVNVPIEQVMADLRSGLLGQTETVYKYGLDLTEASLEQERLRLGIDKSVRSMSQAEKMQLRYSVMVRQSSLAHNDLANTIESPSNQIRILANQITGLGRAIGSVFIGTIGKVLPYINGFVMAIRTMVETLATFVGYKPPEVKNTASGFQDVTSAVEESNGSVSKLKKNIESITLPFDELNTISEPTPPSPSGGGAGAMGAPIDWGLEEYQSQLENVQMKATKIKETILEWLGFTKEVNEETGLIEWKAPDFKDTNSNLEEIYKLATTIGGVFLGWKLGSTLIPGLNNLLSIFGISLPDKMLAVPGIWGAVVGVIAARSVQLFNTSDNFIKGWERVKEVGALLKDIIIIPIIDFIKDIGSAFWDMLPHSVQEGLTKLKQGFSDLIDFLDLDFIDVLITAAGLLMLFFPATAPAGMLLLGFEGISVGIRALGGVSDETWEKIKKGFEEGLEKIKKFFSDTWDWIVEVTQPFIDKMKKAWDIIWGVLKEIGSWLWDTFKVIWDECISFIKEKIIDPFVKFFEKNKDKLKEIWDKFGEAIKVVLERVGELFEDLAKDLEWIWKNIIKPVLDFFGKAVKVLWEDYIKPNLGEIIDLFFRLGEDLMTALDGILDFIIGVFTGDWEKAWEGVKKIFTGIWDSMVNIAESVINSLINAINFMIKQLNKIPGIDISLIRKVDLGKKNDSGELQTVARPDEWKSTNSIFTQSAAASMGEKTYRNYIDRVKTMGDLSNLASNYVDTNKTSRALVTPKQANINFEEQMSRSMSIAQQRSQESQQPQIIENVLKLDGKTIYKNQKRIDKSRGIDFNTTAFAR